MTTSTLFWDRMANRYAKSPISNKEAYERKLEITRKYFTPQSQVLEFGCGTGSTAILHSPFVKHIHAIDVSEKMLAIANSKVEAEDINNITFQKASIEEFDGAENSYDVILGLSILHLLNDKRAAMNKVHKMLKPGGVFVSSTYCGRGKNAFVRMLLSIGAAVHLLPKVKFFSPESLQMSVGDAGFRLDHVWQPEGSDALFIVARKPV